jgi:hypothetical protein
MLNRVDLNRLGIEATNTGDKSTGVWMRHLWLVRDAGPLTERRESLATVRILDIKDEAEFGDIHEQHKAILTFLDRAEVLLRGWEPPQEAPNALPAATDLPKARKGPLARLLRR